MGELSLGLGQSIVLGLVHGPAELLPISSSGHVTLVPWLLGWDYDRLDPELRKSFEVALHAGAAGALLISLRDEVEHTVRTVSPRLALLIGLSFIPPAAAGYVLEDAIEKRLGRPGSVAAGLLIGSVAMLLADRTPGGRSREEATVADALWIGTAQACALMPGVSRSGATLAAARRRGFSRGEADVLSRHVALPIIAAATVRRLSGLRRQALGTQRAPVLAGTLASFASTLGSTWIIGRLERDRALRPYALYRLGLAALVSRRLIAGKRRSQCPTGTQRHRSGQ